VCCLSSKVIKNYDLDDFNMIYALFGNKIKIKCEESSMVFVNDFKKLNQNFMKTCRVIYKYIDLNEKFFISIAT